MWWGSDPEGEGSSKEPPQNQQLVDLQDQFEQQQTLIAQLKEMLRKTEQSSVVSREKVDEYASTLSEINERAKRSKLRKSEGRKSDLDDSIKTSETSSRKSTVVTPAKEKINLLRQQLEENRERLAQRDKNQKGFEEIVNQLKAQFDDSQVIINQSQMNIPKMDAVPVIGNIGLDSSKEDLLSALKSKDDCIAELNAKVQQLQANVLDLQENVKEKDCVIEARTKAITLLSENLSKKGKNTLDMLDETKEQMRAMQENFIALETRMKTENTNLQTELQLKETEVRHLQERNNELEIKCSDLQVINNKLEEEINSKVDNSVLEMKIKELSALNESLTSKISVLESEEVDSRSTSPQKNKRGRGKKSKPESRIAELEKQVQDLEQQATKQSDTTDGDEIVKLTKQLEEMNKTMIKMKAQHKAKLKEVQKKTDSSEKLTQFEMENLKLGQRVAELEVEKGNLQLRLVDYESNKDKEYIADLENKIEEQKMQIENHIRTITSLESEITTSASEIQSLRSELDNFMHIENAQVCSEMTSVQLEEQLDKEVSQKKEIQNKFNTIVKDNEELVEKMETLSREKQELVSKLENYMQENMDLIDRLEKLSAEKVSSAESIEIVESLTQQEKLEIEAYQKHHLDFAKPSSELEESPELNESVTKLTEETTELMERIELFAVERREVMDKMDNLTSENQQLILKIDKYESEKLNLEERYDNLCNERDILNTKVENLLKENEELLQKVHVFSKEIHEKANIASKEESDALKEQVTEYQTLLENQKQQIIALQGELLKKTENEFITKVNMAKINEEKGNMNQHLQQLQREYDGLVKENEELKRKLKGSAELVQEKDNLESVLRETREQLREVESELAKNVNLVTDLRNVIEDNKNEHVQTAELIEQLEKQCETLKLETQDLKETVLELNQQIEEKDKTNDDNTDTINFLSTQLTELKDCMTDNFDQLQQYESEMNKNTRTIDQLTEQLNELNYKIIATEHMLELKDVEINNLKTEHTTCEHTIANLGAELTLKDEQFRANCSELKDRCQSLEQQIQTNSGTLEDIKGPFERKIAQLETRNKDQVDKMKKIAANLKKKAVMCQELEGKLKEATEKCENECREKNDKDMVIDEQRERIQSLESELENTKDQIEELTVQCTNLNGKMDNYEAYISENMMLNDDLAQMNTNITRLNETIVEKEQLIHSLQTDSERNQNETVIQLQNQIELLRAAYETTKNALDAKLQEKDMFIESLEAENGRYKERVFKLEEGLSHIEERRQSLEEKAVELRVQLEAKVTACEEACQSEDFLERRLAALMSHDELIEKTLKQTTTENQELNDKLKTIMSENDVLQSKLNESISKLRENEQSNEKHELIENENLRLQNVITALENEMKKAQSEYERVIDSKNNEIENMETELNAQVHELNAERKNILNKCERLEDTIKEYTNTEQLLTDENDQLKQTLARIKSDLDKAAVQNENLREIIASNVVKMEQLEKQLANLKLREDDKSTSDAESLRKQIEMLQRDIVQKDGDIQNYQRQNMQLQMASFSAPPTGNVFESTSSVFDITPAVSEVQHLNDSLTQSDTRCTHLANEIREVKEQLDNAQSEAQQSREQVNALQQQNNCLLKDLEQQTEIVKRLQDELSNQLLRQTAEVGVNDIISTAEDTVSKHSEALQITAEKNLVELEHKLKTMTVERDDALEKIKHFTSPQEELFTKQEQHHDVSATVPSVKMTEEESKAELLNKIKTLEFMLFNIEREKDDTLAQCHEFTNELTRLVYEREKLIKDKSEVTLDRKEVDLSALEGLIMQSEDINSPPEIGEQLCSVEYPPVNIQVNENIEHQPVVEEILQPKTTYQCFDKEPKNLTGWGTEDTKIKQSIEAQIIAMDTTKITPEERQQFESIEFERIQIPAPKTEPLATNKSAYLCYPDECKDILSADTFASEEDGWGWNAEEATKLEAEHRQTQTHAKVEQLEERVNDLEVERSRLLEEIKTSQVRSGKLIKKLKDMKLKNDSLTAELNKKSTSDFCDLDAAIQDELHTQIKAMEQKLAEANDETVRDRAERDTMLKRIDVLTSANERMVEMKEKQDGELQFWQFKNRELASKLEQLEWGDDGGNKTPASDGTPDKTADTDVDGTEYKKKCSELDKKVQELNTIVNDLTLDNEEMQCMLEEQRKLRLDAEKAMANIPARENMKSQEEFVKIENDNRRLSEQVVKFNEEKQLLENQIEMQVNTNGELQSKIDELQLNVERLIEENTSTKQDTIRIEQLQMENEGLQKQIQQLNGEYETGITNQIETHRTEIVHLQGQISTLQEDKRQLEIVVAEYESVIVELKLQVQQLETEKSACELKIQEILSLQSADEKLQQINEKLMATFSELENKNKELAELNTVLNAERVQAQETLSNVVQQLSKEWSERLDQRGNDVAESWKLHLDARETEFAQKEHDLQSQVRNLSGKNEDLEKQLESVLHSQNTASNNVIESLQQRLNEKQLEVTELSKQLQDALTELQSKRTEIKNMEQSQEMKDTELGKLKTQTIAMEEQYENLLSNNKSDLASLRLQISEQDHRITKEQTDKENLQTQLDTKIAEYQQLEAKIAELNASVAEDNSQIVELRQLIETQVLKIEQLKGELYEKSNDYDALVAEFDSLHPAEEVAAPVKEKHVHFEDYPVVKSPVEEQKAVPKSDNIAEPVSRAELDLALYMWHQRDVRCEELTLELMHLLEERDTLQLRLSNALRMNEDLRNTSTQQASERQPTTADKDSPKIHKSTGAIPKSKAIGTELATEATEQTATQTTVETTGDTENLADKLSQLRSIGYRDKTLQDDQESRYIQQMSVMQQHRDLASKLPAEAAARLVDASYTLSRDVQSPSKVLLNWLWGRSTPKVNDV